MEISPVWQFCSNLVLIMPMDTNILPAIDPIYKDGDIVYLLCKVRLDKHIINPKGLVLILFSGGLNALNMTQVPAEAKENQPAQAGNPFMNWNKLFKNLFTA